VFFQAPNAPKPVFGWGSGRTPPAGELTMLLQVPCSRLGWEQPLPILFISRPLNLVSEPTASWFLGPTNKKFWIRLGSLNDFLANDATHMAGGVYSGH